MNTALLAMLALAAGSGGTWSDSFDPKTLATYLDSNAASVLVAAAGERADDAKQTVQALIPALRRTGRTALVTDDEALGDLSGLSDDQIVTKARSTTATASVVVVVRVYPGAPGQPPSAVVAFHDARSGQSLSTFSVAEGAPLGARAGPVAPATLSATQSASEPAQAEQAFVDRGIWPQGETSIAFTRHGNEVVSSWTVFTRGKYGPVLDGADLYDYLGRADLAHSYRARHATRLGLVIGGFLVAAGGAALFAIGFASAGACTTIDSNTGNCTAHQTGDPPLMIAGGSLAGVGVVTGLVGALINPYPISDGETLRLIDQFNDGLRNGGAGPHAERESDSGAPSTSTLPVQLGVFTLPSGGGLSLSMKL